MKKITIAAAAVFAAAVFSSCSEQVPPAPAVTETDIMTEITDITSDTAEVSETSAETAAVTESDIQTTEDTSIYTELSEEKSTEESTALLDKASSGAKVPHPAEMTSVAEKASEKQAKPAETTAAEKPEPKDIPAADSGKKVEVYSKLYSSDLIPEGAKVTDDERLDTSAPGVYTAVIRYEKDGESTERKISYTVADTEPPVILNGGWDITLKTGRDFDITNWVGAGDYYDDNVTLTYSGEVDTSAEGKYPITVTASDSSGNNTSWDVTVKVVDTLPDSDWDEGDKLPFDELAERYGAEGTLGIDVSKWQGDIDFERVRDAGCKFVMMRIGKDTDGIVADEKFECNFAAARAAGLKVGVYFYSCANSEEEIKADAAWIAETLQGQKLDFPVAFDWESFSNYQNYHMSIHKLNSLYELFDAQMNSYGYDTMLYSSKNFLLNFWQTDKTVWLAHYTDRTNYTGRFEMWQLSSTGRIDGIDGAVDLDIWYN